MKAALDAIIQRDQAEYLERLHPQTDSLLREMEQYGGSTMSPVLIGKSQRSWKSLHVQSMRNGHSRSAWRSVIRPPISLAPLVMAA